MKNLMKSMRSESTKPSPIEGMAGKENHIMKSIQNAKVLRWAAALLPVLMLSILTACTTQAAVYADSVHTTPKKAAASSAFSFKMIPSPGIKACLPKASGDVTITPGDLNDEMKVSVTGLAPWQEYDLFVTELPNKPFGVSWYQSDLKTDKNGNGSVTVRGIFDKETFSVSPGGPSAKFGAVHQFHLGLWFNDPKVPFNLGCEPGATTPIVTPFNGEQNAGIQVLNTANFPDNAGPLSKVSR